MSPGHSPPENKVMRHKREREFQARVLAKVEKPKENQFWALLNKPFTLWFFSLILVSIFGSYLSAYQQCRKDADDEIERGTKIARELFQRELRIKTIILTSNTVAEMRQEIAKPNSYYPELSGLSLDILEETYTSLMNRVIGVQGFPPTPRQLALAHLHSISLGVIPPDMTDKDIPTIREYADQLLARAWPLPLPGFGVSPYQPACSPSNLWDRLLYGTEAHIVRRSDKPPTPPKVLPLPKQQVPPRART